MRMEDLDERSRPPFVDSQLRDLEALGVDWDGPVVFQSQRLNRYAEIFDQMMKAGQLYECYCTRKELAAVASAPHRPPGSYPGTCRDLLPEQRQAPGKVSVVESCSQLFGWRRTTSKVTL